MTDRKLKQVGLLEIKLSDIHILDDVGTAQDNNPKVSDETNLQRLLEPPPLPPRSKNNDDDKQIGTQEFASEEEKLKSDGSNLEILKNSISPDYHVSILIIVYQLSQKMVSEAYEISKNVEHQYKRSFLNSMVKWSLLINQAARRLFSDGKRQVTDDELAIVVELDLLVIPFQKSPILGQSVILQFLLSLLREGSYSGITRSFLNRLRKLFNISYRDFTFLLEYPISRDLILSARNSEGNGIDAQKEVEERHNKSRFKRLAWTSLGAIGGGVALAVSGGLAAPLLLPYVGSVLGASSLLAGATGVTIVTSLFGATGAGLAGYRISRRTGSVKDFTFLPLKNKRKTAGLKPLHVTICISGWITSMDEITDPWASLEDGDVFAMQFEAETLLTIGQGLTNLFATQVVGYAAGEVLKKTVMAGLVAAVAWPLVLLQAGSIIDNPWSIGLDRADKAGRVMADALINRAQGNRPVTLVGFSLGGRAIFSCLLELLSRSETDASVFDLVENVVILGAPITTSRESWMGIKALVSGRLVNGFVSEDWILSFLHRTYNYGQPVAGNVDLHKLWATVDETGPGFSQNSQFNSPLYPGSNCPDDGIVSPAHGGAPFFVESIDLSGIVEGHLDYVRVLPSILSHLGLATSSD